MKATRNITAKFTAIPVGQGDAFFLERDGFSVLVDGGRSRSGFPLIFRQTTKAAGANIVICTHNDADHANGILGFIEAGMRCDELWLPGRWLTTLPDVLRPLHQVSHTLVEDLSRDRLEEWATKWVFDGIEWPHPEHILEIYAKYARKRSEQAGTDHDGSWVDAETNGWPESCIEMLEQAESWESDRWFVGGDPYFWEFLDDKFFGPHGFVYRQIFRSLVDAASRIHAIAMAAFHRGIRIRWFEFNPTLPQGGTSALRPVNSKEVARVQSRDGSLAWVLAMTVSNKESLVFWAPPIEQQHPGVLFTADSDLAGAHLPTNLSGAIVTAPHHGSEANSHAYTEILRALGNNSSAITWVRSDGNYKSRPGATYRGLNCRRLCTLCQPKIGSTPKQSVKLFSKGHTWKRGRATAICSCL